MKIAKRSIILLGLILMGVIGVRATWWWLYPYGARWCFLPCMLGSLLVYAHDNHGWFPDGATLQDALRKLFPDYAESELAGISGDIHAVTSTLKRNGVLDERISSWVYFPGFRDSDNLDLAIIWEGRGGLGFSGRRRESGSHAVGFVDEHHEHIPASRWADFVEEQKQLRERILASRNDEN
jgi:hypothetical protein